MRATLIRIAIAITGAHKDLGTMPGLLPNFSLPFLVTLLFIAAMRPTARRIGLIDRPGGRKSHHGEVPLIGGICMLGGLLIGGGSLAYLTWQPALLVAASFLALVGALDDRFELRASYRLAAQCFAGVLAVLGGVVVMSLGTFGDAPFYLGPLAIPFTLLTVMSFVNAFNFQDGGDGLAGGQALICLISLLLLDHFSGGNAHAGLIAALIGCVAAFLAFNAPLRAGVRAKIFMGDAGAMFLGFSLVWLAILMSQGTHPVIAPVTALWIGALPVLDFFGSMARRVATKRRPWADDAEHLHHLLGRIGLTRRGVFLGEMSASATLAAIGLLGHFLLLPESVMLWAMGTVAALYYWIFCSGRFFQRQGDPMPKAPRRFYLTMPSATQ